MSDTKMVRMERTTLLGLLFLVAGIATLLGHWWYDHSWHTLPNVFGFGSMVLGALLLDPASVGESITRLASAIRSAWRGQ